MNISRWMDLKLTAEGAERGRLEAQRKLEATQSELAIWKLKACEAAEREAALREELAGYKQGAKVEADAADEAREMLKAAEQRNAELLDALQALVSADSVTMESAMGKAEAALKPTESGASE